jgi:hypothetical protein
MMVRMQITVEGKTHPVYRDVVHRPPPEVHLALGTSSEVELQHSPARGPPSELQLIALFRPKGGSKGRLTGSAPFKNTIGIFVVAEFAAKAVTGPPEATITETGRRTNSSASAGR